MNYPTFYHTTLIQKSLTAGAVHIRFFTFLLAHYISAFKHIEDKSDINQLNLKFVDLHFVKYE